MNISIKKYIFCSKGYILKLYLSMCAIVCLLVFIDNSPVYPFSENIGKNILICTLAFFIFIPYWGLIFTQKSLYRVRLYLPYKDINNIYIDEQHQKLTINYNIRLWWIKTKKEYSYVIHVRNYKTTLSELNGLFPKNITRIYTMV